MIIRTVVITPFSQNARIVMDEETRAAAVIDPGGDIPMLLGAIVGMKCKLESIILTHAHIDHCGGVVELVAELQKKGIAPLLVGHKIEKDFRASIEKQALMFGLSPSEYRNSPEPGRYLEDGDIFRIGKLECTALFTPGHSPGHLSFYFPGDSSEQGPEPRGGMMGVGEPEKYDGPVVIGGDALFRDSIGRTDLPGGNHQQLITSIREKLLTLPGETRVLAGHGPDTTIERERDFNPFLAG